MDQSPSLGPLDHFALPGSHRPELTRHIFLGPVVQVFRFQIHRGWLAQHSWACQPYIITAAWFQLCMLELTSVEIAASEMLSTRLAWYRSISSARLRWVMLTNRAAN